MAIYKLVALIYFKENKLETYLYELKVIETADGQKELMPEEKVLLKILKPAKK